MGPASPRLETRPDAAWLTPILLGLCPALAATTRVSSALWLSLASLIALGAGLSSSLALRRLPGWASSPLAFAAVLASVGAVESLASAFLPAVRAELGIYLPVTMVSCLVLGNASEADASLTLRRGLGLAAGLVAAAVAREGLGAGTLTLPTIGSGRSLALPGLADAPAHGLLLPAGGLIVAGYLAAVARFLARRLRGRAGEPPSGGPP